MQGLDSRAVEWLAGLDLPVVTPLMEAVTVMGASGLVWLVIAAALALRRRDPAPLAAVAVTVVSAGVLGSVLKNLADRPRPPVAHPEIAALVQVPGSSSMPSGHALTAFACAVVLAALAPRWRVWLFALAAAIAFSRVYLGVHYPSDVLAGAAVGAVLGLAIAGAMRRVWPSGRAPVAARGGQTLY